MCLILLAHRVHPAYPLVVAANRDEFHARPAASSHFWRLPGGILAGRDLEAGGTWLGVNSAGCFAAITNVSEGHADGDWLSRGDLVQQFLAGEDSADSFASLVDGQCYRGFNLLLWDRATLVYTTNRGESEALPPGIYGLANGGLDEGRFKVRRGTAALAAALDSAVDDNDLASALVAALSDHTPPPSPEPRRVPGMSDSMLQALGACFIEGDTYGTRASTVVLLNDHRGTMLEKVYAPGGVLAGTSHHHLAFGPGP